MSAQRWSAWSFACVLAAACLFVLPSVAASSDIIDQANDSVTPSVGWNIAGYWPMGQEFTPSLQFVDFVELYVENWSSTAVGAVQVELHLGSVHGALLGSTGTVSVPSDFVGVVRCVFPSTVDVAPGQLHAFVVLDHSFAGLTLFDTDDLYPSGRLVLDGGPFPTEDAWFREGMSSTGAAEPDVTWGAIKGLFR